MNNWKSVGGSIAIITLMGSTAAFADVTAQEVWTDWHDYMADFGYQITSNDTASAGMVTVNDLTLMMKIPDEDETIKVVLGQITFKDQGDGTVAISFGDKMPMMISLDDDFSATLNYGQTGMSMVASGSAGNMSYDLKAPELTLTLADLMIEGKKIPDAVLNLILKNVVSNTASKTGNLRDVTQTMSVGSIDYKFSLAEPDGGVNINVKGAMADVLANSKVSLPKGLDFQKMALALTNGFAANGKIAWGAGGYEFDTANHGDTMKGKSSSGSGSLSFEMDRDHLRYSGSAKGNKASISGSDIPLPSIDYEIADAVFDMLMPINKTQTPSDYSLTVKLGDLSVSDDIWAMLDPMAALPHDPATLNIVLGGKANWLVDIMDPESEEMKTADVPVQLHALTLKELQLKIGGADLTGVGDFTFNNDDLKTFDGLPAPTGEVSLKLVGGNGLLDNLIKMGMVPQDEAMGVRMMMGLFAVAGEGEDTLTSKIEVKGDGSIYANGQRLK